MNLRGPLKGDYSLAVVNRAFAQALVSLGADIRLYANEDDILEDPHFCSSKSLVPLIGKRDGYDPSRILLINDWPVSSPRCNGLKTMHCFAWEESIVPFPMAATLSQYDLITTTASFVTMSLLNSGVSSRVVTVGNGVDHILTPGAKRPLRGIDDERPFTFLHISSCFPRKGIDVLLAAYFQEFTSSDNVRLLIKSFDNPHNRELRGKISHYQKQHPNPPTIELLMQSLDPTNYYQLFLQADCLVSPSYGEGFLFPAAEAILNNTPVITTGWGGQCDFCTEETAWLIDYRLELSTSHVAAPGGCWAIPDTTHLRALMRKMTQIPLDERVSKLNSGQALLSGRFSWKDAATRYLGALESLDSPHASKKAPAKSRPAPNRSRHVLVSTFNQKCGIATFSSELAAGASSCFDIAGIVTEIVERPGPSKSSIPLAPVWRRHSSTVPAIVDAVRQIGPDHVVIQHHPGIFSWEMLAAIIAGLNNHTRVTAQLHSAADGYDDLLYHAALIKLANRIVVHSASDYILAAKALGAERTSLIPHGIGPSIASSPPGAFHDASAGEEVKIASFGFMAPHKGFHKVIEAVGMLRRAGANVTYRILSAVDGRNDRAVRYMRYCFERIEALGLTRYVELYPRFLATDEAIRLLGECQIGVLAYDDVMEGASGACRMMLRANLPLVVSRLPIFSDVEDICVPVGSGGLSMPRMLYKLASSPPERRRVLERQAAFIEATQWEKVAAMIFGGFNAY